MREDIKRRREKYETESQAQQLFGGRDLVLDRKPGMEFALYKYMRAVQTRALKKLFVRSSNPRISAVMRPALPSLHLVKEVAKRYAIKNNLIEEVKPERISEPNFITRIFNFFRTLANQNNGSRSFAS